MGSFRDDLSQVVAVAIPAAGAGFTFTPSGAEFTRVRSVSFVLTTSATVATRTVTLTINDGTGAALASIPSPANQTAGQADNYTFGLYLPDYVNTSSTSVVAPLPEMWMRLGQSVVVSCANIASGDTFTKIRVVVDQRTWMDDEDY